MTDKEVGDLWREHYPYRHMNDNITTDEDSPTIVDLIRKLVKERALFYASRGSVNTVRMALDAFGDIDPEEFLNDS